MSEKPEKPTRPAKSTDPEILVIARLTRLLEPLDTAARRRVLTYLAERYATEDAAAQKPGEQTCRHPGFGA